MTTVTTRGMDMQAAAKELNVKGGRNGLYRLLRELNVFVDKQPHYAYVRQGFFALETKGYKRGPVVHQYTKPLVTGTGLTWLREKIDQHKAKETAPCSH